MSSRPVSQGGNSTPLILLVFVILILVVSGLVWFTRGQSKKLEPAITESTNDFSAVVFKGVNEFFPLTIGSSPIKDTGLKNYKVGLVSGTVYTREGATSSDPSATVEKGFVAFYGEESRKDKTVRVVYLKFPNKNEVEDVRNITENVFGSLAEGYRKVSLPLRGVTYWAAYRTVPAEKVEDNYSGDARVLFPEALTLLQIQTAGNYSLEEFQNIVKSYIESLISSGTEYVLDSEVMPRS